MDRLRASIPYVDVEVHTASLSRFIALDLQLSPRGNKASLLPATVLLLLSTGRLLLAEQSESHGES
jgi:hypothetical protein